MVVRIAPEVISAIVSRPYDGLGARPDRYYIDDLLSAEFLRYAATNGQPIIAIEGGPEPTCVPV